MILCDLGKGLGESLFPLQLLSFGGEVSRSSFEVFLNGFVGCSRFFRRRIFTRFRNGFCRCLSILQSGRGTGVRFGRLLSCVVGFFRDLRLLIGLLFGGFLDGFFQSFTSVSESLGGFFLLAFRFFFAGFALVQLTGCFFRGVTGFGKSLGSLFGFFGDGGFRSVFSRLVLSFFAGFVFAWLSRFVFARLGTGFFTRFRLTFRSLAWFFTWLFGARFGFLARLSRFLFAGFFLTRFGGRFFTGFGILTRLRFFAWLALTRFTRLFFTWFRGGILTWFFTGLLFAWLILTRLAGFFAWFLSFISIGECQLFGGFGVLCDCLLSFRVWLTGRLGLLCGFDFGLRQFESFFQRGFGLFASGGGFLVFAVERLLRGFGGGLLSGFEGFGQLVRFAFLASFFCGFAFGGVLASFGRGFGDFLLLFHGFQRSFRVARFEFLRSGFGLLLSFQGVFNVLCQPQRVGRLVLALSFQLSGFGLVHFLASQLKLFELFGDCLLGFFNRLIDGTLGDFDFLQLIFGQLSKFLSRLRDLFANGLRRIGEVFRSGFGFRCDLLRFLRGFGHRSFEGFLGRLHRGFVFLRCGIGHRFFGGFRCLRSLCHFVERFFGFLGFGEGFLQCLGHFRSRFFQALGDFFNDVGDFFLFFRQLFGFLFCSHLAFGNFFRRVRNFAFGSGGPFECLGSSGEFTDLDGGFHPLRFGDLFLGRGEGSFESVGCVFKRVFRLSFRFFIRRGDFFSGSVRSPRDGFLSGIQHRVDGVRQFAFLGVLLNFFQAGLRGVGEFGRFLRIAGEVFLSFLRGIHGRFDFLFGGFQIAHLLTEFRGGHVGRLRLAGFHQSVFDVGQLAFDRSLRVDGLILAVGKDVVGSLGGRFDRVFEWLLRR